MVAAGKRQRDAETGDRNDRNKRRNQPGGDREHQSVLPTADDTTYRILCPEDKVGGVIGKGGNVIKSIRRDSRARIKVTDAVPGLDERVILIWSSRTVQEKGKDGGGEGKKREKEKDGSLKEKGGAKKSSDGVEEEQEFLCPAQEALFKIHARILEVEDGKPGEKDVEIPSQVTARLLLPNNQIGCLIGKGGKVIEKMRQETRAQIRILPKDQVPGCALPSDELLQISGDFTVVKMAMYRISSKIHENPPRSRPQGAPTFLPPEPLLPPGGPNTYPPENFLPYRNSYLGSQDVGLGGPFAGLGSHSLPGYGGFGSADLKPSWALSTPAAPVLPRMSASHSESTKQEFSIRVLCLNEKVGQVIGKGGSAIRHLQDSTGAHIKVEDPVSESEERVITISANEFFNAAVSPVIEAVVQLQSKRIGCSEGNESRITMRLLVPSKQIGCLLGKKGAVISEMRQKTAADIRVLNKKDLPKFAERTETVVQVMGEQHIAQVALTEVLTRLRNDVFKDQINVQADAGALTGSLSGLGDSYDPRSLCQMYPPSGFTLQEGSRYMSGNYGSMESLQAFGRDYGVLPAYDGGLLMGHSTAGGSALNERLFKNISGPSREAGMGIFNSSKTRGASGEKAKARGRVP